jgi:hypothetical protein
MRKKLLGLSVALGITALASWATPAFATSYCTGRVCGADPESQCVCFPNTAHAGQVFSCQAWLDSHATACN